MYSAYKEKVTFPSRVIRSICLAVIKFYQLTISPLLPSSCIYTPTCSQYALEALEKYGLFKGGFMALRRIFRCTPFHRGGFDPVR
jgi:putative membrane protein insertion efficiency factor